MSVSVGVGVCVYRIPTEQNSYISKSATNQYGNTVLYAILYDMFTLNICIVGVCQCRCLCVQNSYISKSATNQYGNTVLYAILYDMFTLNICIVNNILCAIFTVLSTIFCTQYHIAREEPGRRDEENEQHQR